MKKRLIKTVTVFLIACTAEKTLLKKICLTLLLPKIKKKSIPRIDLIMERVLPNGMIIYGE